MNSEKIYDDLISSRKTRIVDSDVYYEKHHIVMKSMGGTDEPENLVMLTAREHFLAHWLLWRIYKNRQSALAFSMMKRGKNRKIESSREYAEIREALSLSQMGDKNHRFGKKLSEEHKAKLKQANTGRSCLESTKHKISIANKGNLHTDETKALITKRNKGNKNAAGHTYICSEATANKISIKLSGRELSTEHCANISKGKSGKKRLDMIGNSFSKGKKLSQETRDKMKLSQQKRRLRESPFK